MRWTPRAGWAERVRRLDARAIAICAALASLSAGCGEISKIGPSTCDRSPSGNPPILYTDGTVEDGVYMSTPWDGGAGEDDWLLYFPGGMRYAIEHKLGETPRFWQIYLSFDRKGTAGGTMALATGNQAEVPCIDGEHIVVFNGSCSEYWMLIVAGGGEGTAPPPSSETCYGETP
jgi:hypothetical protein